MNSTISPAIYRFIIKHFSDPQMKQGVSQRVKRYCQDADSWIDCWVDCAAVTVQNNERVRLIRHACAFLTLSVGLVTLFESRTAVLGSNK